MQTRRVRYIPPVAKAVAVQAETQKAQPVLPVRLTPVVAAVALLRAQCVAAMAAAAL